MRSFDGGNTEIEESLSEFGGAKLHGRMCKLLSLTVHKVLEIFPFIEASRPRSKSGIQALCLLHVALERAKNLLKHCSDCSRLYLAITGDSILMKFEKAKCVLQESLMRVEDIVPQAIGCQIVEIVGELEGTTFELDQSEKEVGDDMISLLQKERENNCSPSNRELEHNCSPSNRELEVFHHAALRLGITSSRAALTERRALRKLIERARAEEDKRKESIVLYLLHLMRKYSKHFRSEVADDTDSQGSTPCSPTVLNSFDDVSVHGGHNRAFSRHFSNLNSFNFNQNGRTRSENAPIPPEEFRCPISLQLMYDPVIISSGQTYERACIEKWLNNGHSTCPKTQQQLAHLGLTSNFCVKDLIVNWCENNGIPIPDSPPESLDVNYWRLAISDCEVTNSRSLGSLDSSMLKGVKMVLLEESGVEEELRNNEVSTPNNNSCEYNEGVVLGRYDSLLAALNDSRSIRKRKKAVQQIRFLLKDDEEARIYMGANGAVDALVQLLRSAVDDGDEMSQEVGAMALFNLAVNNNRNKGLVISAGVIPLLEFMISNSETQESATALYLNLSCLDEAKPLIGLSPAVPFLVQFLYSDDERSSTKHDALYTLYNLSTHPSNIRPLINAGIICGLHSLLTTSSSGDKGLTWVEKALTVLINLASSKSGRKDIMSTPGLVAALATVLDIGEPAEQEQVVSCLLILCSSDEDCSELVLQEGVIPALVSVSVDGTARGREKAQRLLKLFREQRQREPSPVQLESSGRGIVAVAERKPLCKTRSRLGRTLSSLWKNKNLSVYQC